MYMYLVKRPSICLSVHLSVRPLTAEPFDLRPTIFGMWGGGDLNIGNVGIVGKGRR